MQPNEYALLVKDNERRCANLALADNNTIDVAMETIRKASWNLYEVERVRQDLITMAERAEAGGKTLAETLGPNRAELFDAMAREMEPGNFLDWLCTFGSNWYIPFHIGTNFLQALFGDTFPILIYMFLPFVLLLSFIRSYIARRIWMTQSLRRWRGWLESVFTIVVLLLYMALVLWALPIFPQEQAAWYYIIFELCLYLASRLYRRIRYNRAAARRPWR